MQKLILILSVILVSNTAFAYKPGTGDTLQSKPMLVKDSLLQHPEYPGGESDMMKFLSDNLKYPKKARKQGIKGRVVAKFVIDKDGSVINAEVIRGIGGGCDEEALRVINSMPKWKPGYKDGNPVKVYYTLPITFNLGD